VLGECVAAATVAMQSATSTGLSAEQVGVAAGGLLLIFGLKWWYFEHPADEGLPMSQNLSFLWGYAHYAVFASVAALGAGLEVALESTRRGSTVSPMTAGGAVAVAVSVYLLVTGIVRPGCSRTVWSRCASSSPLSCSSYSSDSMRGGRPAGSLFLYWGSSP
jgi:low temperature requirement protein LtrA